MTDFDKRFDNKAQLLVSNYHSNANGKIDYSIGIDECKDPLKVAYEVLKEMHDKVGNNEAGQDTYTISVASEEFFLDTWSVSKALKTIEKFLGGGE